jgi:Arc/MetJ-type ribon-helix-helix transcriptional regulator
MPLHTGKLEEKSDAVRYAVKQYRKKRQEEKEAQPETKDGKLGAKSKPDSDNVKVVKIKKQPVKSAIEKIKKYFS